MVLRDTPAAIAAASREISFTCPADRRGRFGTFWVSRCRLPRRRAPRRGDVGTGHDARLQEANMQSTSTTIEPTAQQLATIEAIERRIRALRDEYNAVSL